MITEKETERLENIFTYHKPFGNQSDRYESIRNLGHEMAVKIFMACPESPERTIALRRIQEAVFFANASIAIHEKEE